MAGSDLARRVRLLMDIHADESRCYRGSVHATAEHTGYLGLQRKGRSSLSFFGSALLLLVAQSALYAGDESAILAPNPSASPATYEPFLPGLIDAFSQALTSPAYTPPQPGSTPTPRRGYPAPFDGAPFFNSDYQIGGSQLIGDPGEATVWPLMKAIYGSGTFGQWLKDNRINIYGWVEGGYNPSSSSHSNFPQAYDLRPNQPELDQFVVYLERLADEYQTDHIDFGFRLSAPYGLNYRFTISKGFLN